VREEGEQDRLSEMMEILFYELPKLEKHVRDYERGEDSLERLPADEKWCIYMKYKADERLSGMIAALSRQEAGIMNAERALKKMNREKEQWARALWREKRAMDYEDYQLGIKEAIHEAVTAAREEALAEGREKTLRETAKHLKDMGLAADQIAAATGLAPAEIEGL
jgi:predicted transposase/invertase (TIGR01784 family)